MSMASGGQRICDICKQSGVLRSAVAVEGGVDKCKEHVTKPEAAKAVEPPVKKPVQNGAPVAKQEAVKTEEKEEEKVMKQRSEINWDAVQKERDKGVSVSALSKKYHVSEPTIYNHTGKARIARPIGEEPDKPVRRKAKRKLVAKKVPRPVVPTVLNGSGRTGRFTPLLVELRAEIEKLQHQVEVLESLED